MNSGLRQYMPILWLACSPFLIRAQSSAYVRVTKVNNENKIEVQVGGPLFTRFIYPDSLEKPVLFPVLDAGGTTVTRGFPLEPRPGEPTDHPHHIGIWLTYENVNGLDFWNNSYAIPPDKKSQYGWIKTDSILEMTSGITGILRYHARWVNQKNQTLLEENTCYEFSGPDENDRIIDRITEFTAETDVLFADAKDGMLGLRLTRELQIPNAEERQYTDNKGNVTTVKKNIISNGNYLTSEGKQGDSAWSTRGNWCKVYGKINDDSVSITLFDHTGNPNYPTFWHARGYGLFAANPLGEKIFTNGKSSLNLKLKKGEKLLLRYRILIHNGHTTCTNQFLNQMADTYNKIK
jgi:hypothetical protein